MLILLPLASTQGGCSSRLASIGSAADDSATVGNSRLRDHPDDLCLRAMRHLLLAAALAAMLASCRTALLVNPPPVSFAPLPAREVEAAIYTGCSRRRWMPTKIRDGLIRATLHQRSHVAVVNIDYDDDSFQLSYVDSDELRYKVAGGEQRIHSSYNKWIKNLVGDIEIALTEERVRSARRTR
jgi:hypothetical protein